MKDDMRTLHAYVVAGLQAALKRAVIDMGPQTMRAFNLTIQVNAGWGSFGASIEDAPERIEDGAPKLGEIG